MPQKFKALATISAWILFVFGCIDLLGSGWGYMNSGTIGQTPAFDFVGLWAVGAAFLILSVVAMKLRQMLE
jgi:hypothetical protein